MKIDDGGGGKVRAWASKRQSRFSDDALIVLSVCVCVRMEMHVRSWLGEPVNSSVVHSMSCEGLGSWMGWGGHCINAAGALIGRRSGAIAETLAERCDCVFSIGRGGGGVSETME